MQNATGSSDLAARRIAAETTPRATEPFIRAKNWNGLRVEHRRIAPGAQNGLSSGYTALVYVLSGQARVRCKGDGQPQEGLARPGTCWLIPAGPHETLLELDGATECLIMFLPPSLLDQSALKAYGVELEAVQLVHVGGFADPTLAHVAKTLYGLLDQDGRPGDGILADGMRTTLAAHLISNYTVDRWRPAARASSLDAKRLQRVLDFIQAGLAADLSLEDLASEACLSPFHFSRLFHDATGQSPHRYVVERRVEAAQKMLACNEASLAEIALDTGFGSQANFTRVFRKITGVPPGQYRDLGLR